MPLLNLVPPQQRERILQAYRDALCDDFCYEDNCLRCNEKRLELTLPLLVEVVMLDLRQRWLDMEILVAEGVKHKDALEVLTKLLTDLGSPPKRKPRI